jgi:hypothetical protein
MGNVSKKSKKLAKKLHHARYKPSTAAARTRGPRQIDATRQQRTGRHMQHPGAAGTLSIRLDMVGKICRGNIFSQISKQN